MSRLCFNFTNVLYKTFIDRGADRANSSLQASRAGFIGAVTSIRAGCFSATRQSYSGSM